jgi:hypothetical protein
MGILRDFWKTTLENTGHVLPTAKRQWFRMQAQDVFHGKPTQTGLDRLARPVVLTCLKRAGEDTGSDAPYQKILGLKGGKKEFDERFPAGEPAP